MVPEVDVLLKSKISLQDTIKTNLLAELKHQAPNIEYTLYLQTFFICTSTYHSLYGFGFE